jgi:hypothetical protein
MKMMVMLIALMIVPLCAMAGNVVTIGVSMSIDNPFLDTQFLQQNQLNPLTIDTTSMSEALKDGQKVLIQTIIPK